LIRATFIERIYVVLTNKIPSGGFVNTMKK